MKKFIVASFITAAVSASTFAQGNVYFNNGNTSKVSVNSVLGGAATATTPATAGQYYFALFFSPTATTVGGSTGPIIPVAGNQGFYAYSDPNWTLATVNGGNAYGANTATTGRFASLSADASSTTSLTDVAPGAAEHFVILAWSANIGTTVSAVQSFFAGTDGVTTGYVGESDISGAITTGISGSTPTATIFGTGAGYVNPFTIGITSVPEPTSIALAVMGGASLLALRRKKA